MAEILVKRFPEELGSRLPPKRRPWMSEDSRMDIFDAVALALMLPAVAVSQTRAAKTTLDIYVVDVEGGNAVLFVTPSGESVLIDSGNAGMGAVRDAERIMAAAKDAGLMRVDHLITTHYHGDHIGGLAELAARIPIMEFIDHGPNVQPNPATDAFLQGGYRQLYTKTKHTVAKPGDRIPVAGLDWRVATSAAQVIHEQRLIEWGRRLLERLVRRRRVRLLTAGASVGQAHF